MSWSLGAADDVGAHEQRVRVVQQGEGQGELLSRLDQTGVGDGEKPVPLDPVHAAHETPPASGDQECGPTPGNPTR